LSTSPKSSITLDDLRRRACQGQNQEVSFTS
jgi:hypothetical protein